MSALSAEHGTRIPSSQKERAGRILAYRYFMTFFLIAALGACDYYKSGTVELRQGKYHLTSGKDRLTAESAGEQKQETFLVVGGTGRGFFPFTAHLSVIPAENVERVLSDCGGFEQCRAAGELEQNAWVESMFLYAADDDAARQLTRIDELAMTWEYPLVSLTFRKIRILDHTRAVLDGEVPVRSDSFSPNYIVSHIKIIRKNYGE
ncbi:MAG: hypothetical protein ACLFPX_01050 [Candidatus Omnitrophota bacterium]